MSLIRQTPRPAVELLALGVDAAVVHGCVCALARGGSGLALAPQLCATPAALEDAAAHSSGAVLVMLGERACGDAGPAALAQRVRARLHTAAVVLVAGHGAAPPAAEAAGVFDATLVLPVGGDVLAMMIDALVDTCRTRGERDAARARLAAAVRLGGIGEWQWNPHTGESRWCETFAALLGLPPDGAPGSAGDAPWERIHPEDRGGVRAAVEGCLVDGAGAVTYRVRTSDGGERRLRQESLAEPAAIGGPWVVSMAQDVTERQGVEDTIRKLAYYDPLTDLPNRSYLHEYLRSVMVQARRHDRTAALLHVDLDGFKRVNDTLGHAAGDRLLQEVAVRLQGCVRDSDCVTREQGPDLWPAGGESDTVTRFAADEFIVVLSEVASSRDPERVAERIITRLREPVTLNGRDITVSASVGIAVFPDDADDEDALLRNAALAMQFAKRRGRNSHQTFDRSLLAPSVDRLNMEARLRQALDEGGLSLHYQPKVDPVSGRLAGAEALLRWQHPELGQVPPSDFIPIAEETGLILPLGEWVLHEVCSQLAAWRTQGFECVPVSINVSAQQLQDQGLVRKIRRELDAAGLTAPALEFEITESVLMDDAGPGEQRLRELQALGSLVSMDDFGTGYSSLSYLKRLPIDVVKIDRSFVRDILQEEDDQVILRAIITMAHQLRLRIVAEGVETDDQMRLLQEMGCDLIQGYVVSRPVPAEPFALAFLQRVHRLAG